MAAKWIAANPYPGRALVEGLKGDAHYLIVKEDKTLYDFAINAVCALPAAAPLLAPQPCGLAQEAAKGRGSGAAEPTRAPTPAAQARTSAASSRSTARSSSISAPATARSTTSTAR